MALENAKLWALSTINTVQRLHSMIKQVKNEKPVLDYKDEIIDEHSIMQRFGFIKRDRFQVLVSKAIDFTNDTQDKGDRLLLENTKLHIYEDEKIYRQTSGNGMNTIVVNFENEEVIVEAIGFKT